MCIALFHAALCQVRHYCQWILIVFFAFDYCITGRAPVRQLPTMDKTKPSKIVSLQYT